MLRTLLARACLAFMVFACVMAARDAGAQQYKEVPDFKPGAFFTPDQDGEPQQPVHLFERCMLSTDPDLPQGEQTSMCACMAARDAELRRNPPKQEDWARMIGSRLVSPYERFTTKIVAPCLYIEIYNRAREQCLGEDRFVTLFETGRDFHAYCDCYGRDAEAYARTNAEPILTTLFQDGTQPEGMLENTDPARIVMKDVDFAIYMSHRRDDCIGKYGIQTSGNR